MNIEIILKRKVDLEGKIFITGFHGIGYAGYIAVNHIIESTNAELLGYVTTEQYPPIVSLDENRVLTPYELFMYKDFILFLPRFQPPPSEQNDLMRILTEWTVKNRFKEAILIGGLDSKLKAGEEKLRVVPTSRFKMNNKLELKKLDRNLYVVGPLAILLAYYEIKDFPAIALLPYAQRGRPDPLAAATAIQVINQLYDLDISTEQLIKDAKQIEQEIAQLKEQEEKVQREPGSLAMYV
ncbi:MAG: proteasome assembly chaperone family protein [Candidatus Baldrarchaeota archaeon]